MKIVSIIWLRDVVDKLVAKQNVDVYEVEEVFSNQPRWGNYLEQMPEATFEVDIRQRVHLVALDADLANRLTEIAKTRHTSFETLVNTWLRERVLADTATLRESTTEYREE